MAERPLLSADEWLRQISERTASSGTQSMAVNAMKEFISKETDHKLIQRAIGRFELELSFDEVNNDPNRDLVHYILDGLPLMMRELAGERNRVREMEEIIREKEVEERNRVTIVKETREISTEANEEPIRTGEIAIQAVVMNETREMSTQTEKVHGTGEISTQTNEKPIRTGEIAMQTMTMNETGEMFTQTDKEFTGDRNRVRETGVQTDEEQSRDLSEPSNEEKSDCSQSMHGPLSASNFNLSAEPKEEPIDVSNDIPNENSGMDDATREMENSFNGMENSFNGVPSNRVSANHRDSINTDDNADSRDISASTVPYVIRRRSQQRLDKYLVKAENENNRAVDGSSDTPNNKDCSKTDELGSKIGEASKRRAHAESEGRSTGDTETPMKKSRSENNVETPQCVLCDKYPATPVSYVSHLYFVHQKSTLTSNGIYLMCECGKKVFSRTKLVDEHNKKCHGLPFTVRKLGEQ